MNDEIKEILDDLENVSYLPNISYQLNHNKVKKLYDYITNLQQENERLKAQLTDTEWEYQNTRFKYEKQYKKGITEELLEDIETCFFNKENPSMIPIDSLDLCHIFGYIDYLKDYKSRCEKAIELLKSIYMLDNVTITNNACEKIDNAINILQNGGKNNE